MKELPHCLQSRRTSLGLLLASVASLARASPLAHKVSHDVPPVKINDHVGFLPNLVS